MCDDIMRLRNELEKWVGGEGRGGLKARSRSSRHGWWTRVVEVAKDSSKFLCPVKDGCRRIRSLRREGERHGGPEWDGLGGSETGGREGGD